MAHAPFLSKVQYTATSVSIGWIGKKVYGQPYFAANSLPSRDARSGSPDFRPSRTTSPETAQTCWRIIRQEGSISGAPCKYEIAHSLSADGFDASEDGTGREYDKNQTGLRGAHAALLPV